MEIISVLRCWKLKEESVDNQIYGKFFFTCAWRSVSTSMSIAPETMTWPPISPERFFGLLFPATPRGLRLATAALSTLQTFSFLPLGSTPRWLPGLFRSWQTTTFRRVRRNLAGRERSGWHVADADPNALLRWRHGEAIFSNGDGFSSMPWL